MTDIAIQSPFIDIFMAIRQLIVDLAGDTLYIDQDLGQLRNNARPPVTWPCVLIDFEDFTFENLSENVQTVNGTIVIQLGFAPYSNSSQVTPDPYIQQALTYYQYEQVLHWLLEGWSPGDNYGSLIRTSVTTQKRNDRYRVRELRYSIAFEDFSTKPEQQTAKKFTLVLTEEIGLQVGDGEDDK